MVTIKEALDLARQEQSLGNIKDYSISLDGGRTIVWAESPDGGMYIWWNEDKYDYDAIGYA